ncbi:hypothetical protein [Dietzia sp. 179-F 9C3 NHS]|uniref:hypothetical protein n=1 Tax=Dietzia sp. 179-F 9C3 NHS TaxID=3374295 RepID=UPI00387A828A
MTALDTSTLTAAIYDGRFDVNGAIPVFMQFDGAVRSDWARSKGKPKGRSYLVWDDDALREDHTAYLLGRAAHGGRVTRRLLASLTDEQMRALATVNAVARAV